MDNLDNKLKTCSTNQSYCKDIDSHKCVYTHQHTFNKNGKCIDTFDIVFDYGKYFAGMGNCLSRYYSNHNDATNLIFVSQQWFHVRGDIRKEKDNLFIKSSNNSNICKG